MTYKLNIPNVYQEFFNDPKIITMIQKITEFLEKQTNKIYPESCNVFKALELTPLENIKVVILGQDPYHTPGLANGLSFSVPDNKNIPPSLRNIYSNMLNFKHYQTLPKSGSLEHWARQGCLMLNTALTVNEGVPNSHKDIWVDFTDELIKFISTKCNNVIFLLWGSYSLSKLNLIDLQKHKVSISSHPSGLSYKKKLNIYPEFCNCDHFGIINKHLLDNNIETIIW
ncbi:uracil-DNA glycosylase [Hokovirus HKV1]|uniref:Uracil-DNA glycosylase n=1 Tax=Hokovirus HKV1 TaxID=1977638 RepID=A0A1V0SGN6_9VIRU|nr:uracil-DNA glycosylase [Hokovirus HKV1]